MKSSIVFFVSLFLFINSFAQDQVKKVDGDSTVTVKITFIELGSVNCIPCKQMVPVMKSVEEKYGDQLEVIFYDVWKEEQKIYAEKYAINVIPTQVFLNSDGEEIDRHVGFYPESKLDEFLQSHGLIVTDKQN